jgi:hypothetical protein
VRGGFSMADGMRGFEDKDRNWQYIANKCYRADTKGLEFICNDPISKELFLDAVDDMMRRGEFCCVEPLVDFHQNMGDLFYHIRFVRDLDDTEISDLIAKRTGME